MSSAPDRARARVFLTRFAFAFPILLLACRPPAPEMPELVVGGLDYAFELPAEVPAGLTQISFENRGRVPHEMILVELVPGTTVTDIVEVVQSGGDPGDITEQFGGILIADPGEKPWGRLYVELLPGRTYGLVCNFVDAEGDPPHVALGMLRTFTVTGSADEARAAADAARAGADEPVPPDRAAALVEAIEGGGDDAALIAELLDRVSAAEEKLAGLAAAFPQEVYDWRPGDGVRSSGEVFMHVATVNLVFPLFAGHEPPPSTGLALDNLPTAAPAYEGSLVDKAPIEAALAASFDNLRAALQASRDTDLDRDVVSLGEPTTLRAMWVGHVTHLNEHLGQLIAYSRTNGIAPPWSG